MVINFISGLLIHQALQRICYIRNCNCITDTLNRCGSKLCRVDTNNLTVHVQKGAAAVSRVDGCIGLDQSLRSNRLAGTLILTGDRTVFCTDISARQGLAGSQCISDCHNLITDLKVIGISHHGNFDLALCLVLDVGKFYCNNSEVIVRIGTFDLAFYRLIVDKADGKRRCTADNVVVCRNQELIVVLSDNNSGSACRNFLACGSEECLNFFHRCRRNCYQRRHRTRCNIFHGHLAGCFYGIGGITAVCCRCCGGRRNCNFLLLLCCCTDHFRTDCCSPNENTACHESEARCHGKCHAPFFCG